ncbi:MAG: plasmid mobilization relaxosome protein MobC [Pseudomonadota bacterium]
MVARLAFPCVAAKEEARDMARPMKQPDEKRDQRFNLRLTLAEIEHLRREAHRAGINPHDYARRRSLGASTALPSRRRSDPALISELNRIGVNVNQLARAMHMGTEFSGSWEALADELRDVLTRLVRSDGSKAP